MRILHLIREMDDQRAIATLKAQSEEHEVSVVLLHDAVLGASEMPGAIYACADDVRARNGNFSGELVDFDAIVRLIFEHDKVISW